MYIDEGFWIKSGNLLEKERETIRLSYFVSRNEKNCLITVNVKDDERIEKISFKFF